MNKIAVCAAIAVVFFLCGTTAVSQMKDMEGDAKKGHIMIVPKDFEWKDGPASLPAGTKAVVLEGDPTKEGPFTMRVKIPANYKIPPHTHPGVEHVTVLEGSLQMGVGEKWDDKGMTDLPAGGFAVMEIGTKHFAGSKDGATIQVHGIGPWGINYINPADDPRKKKD